MWPFKKKEVVAPLMPLLPAEKPKDVVLEDTEATALLKDFLTDSVKVRVYQLEQMAQRNVVARQVELDRAQRAFHTEQKHLLTRVARAKRMRKQLNELNRAHRLLKLEYKELKVKYDAAKRAESEPTTPVDTGHSAATGS